MLIERNQVPGIAQALSLALSGSQQFASFLNLEYYDLQDLVRQMLQVFKDPDLRNACRQVLSALNEHVILYERHTVDCRATGISIYMSNPLVPQNIFEAHQAMYRFNRFSNDTLWDEMIEVYQRQWKAVSAVD